MSGTRVLVVTTDPLGERMPGPAIRAWHLAEVLAAEHEVTLVSAVACERRHPRMEVCFGDEDAITDLARRADVVVAPGSVVRRYPGIAGADVPLVVDIYDPYHLENLESGGGDADAHLANVARLNGVVTEDLMRGDFFLCASVRQRDFWLGSLAAVGRVNPLTYADDPRLRALVDVVPFGLPATPPVRQGPGLRGRIAGISETDRLVVWGGGVYNWFDPLSLVRAMDQVRRARPEVKLVFLGMQHPNPHIPEMRVATETRELAGRLGLAGEHVFFNEGWVPYDDRADYLLDADIGVSTHLDHIETRFSFRTRVLDYLWAGLPMLLTEGDSLADEVAAAGAGLTVPAGDPDAIAAGLLRLVENPLPREAVHALAERFHWDDVAAPLLAFCSNPHRAPDIAAGVAPALVRSGTSMADVAPPETGSELSSSNAAYLAQIRGALTRISRRALADDGDAEGGAVAAALEDVADAATIDVEVPTASNRQAGRAAKEGIKRLTRWYLRYLAQQTTVLGQATLRLGRALSAQADRTEDTVAGLVGEVGRLRERVERLEGGTEESGRR